MTRSEEINSEVDRTNSFQSRLAEAMQGESNSSFARKCGITETTIRKYLSGKARPRSATLQKIALATGRKASWLLGEDDTKVRDSGTSNKDEGMLRDTELLLNLFKFLPIGKRSQLLKQLLEEVKLCVENVERYNN
ncbi:helix-turn-helix transcriptional regulator [Citrobacter amalonaticus]|uniref:helix-turn-helix domain-containing protein n=1 Tax=Citrobacter amalonaticus TaxID=35703 RepID=UPI00300D05E4